MNQIIKLNYGYNKMYIHGIELLTIKVRVKNSFPFQKLNAEFKVTDSKIQSNKVISFAGIDCDWNREIIKRFTDIMLQYKHDEIDRGHKEHLQVYTPVPDDYEFPW
jgi:hypothetical protein